MISIQKHMHDQKHTHDTLSATATRESYQKLLDGVLQTTAEHMPSADNGSGESFSDDLAKLVGRRSRPAGR